MLGWRRKSKLGPYERGFVCPGRSSRPPFSPSPPPPWPRGRFPAWGWPRHGCRRETEAQGSMAAPGPPGLLGLPQGLFSIAYTHGISGGHALRVSWSLGMCGAPPWVPQAVPSLQGPWGESSPPGLAKAPGAGKEPQGRRDIVGTERRFPLSSSCHRDCPFPSAAACLSFPFPRFENHGCRPAWQDPRLLCRGVQPTSVSPAAPMDVAKVPWQGDALQHPVFCTSPGQKLSGMPLLCRSGPVAGRRVGAGRAPRLGAGPAPALPWPRPRRAVGGLFSAWTGRRMNSITGSRFYSTCQGA